MDNDIQILLNAMQEAGDAIVNLQKTGFTVSRKSNNEILTQADLLANNILKRHLTQAFPEYGWLSEESVDEPRRLSCERVWVVDPIDGTIEFAHGLPEYAISVALVENGIPILASVFNPATGELFYAIKGQGAWLGESKIHCTNVEVNEWILLASRSEYKRGEWDKYQQSHQVKQIGSIAYKLALIAAGKAQATFSLSPKSEWDIAAGVLLVQEAGGIVTNKRRDNFIFNQKNVLVDGIVASAVNINDQIFELINS